MKHDVVCVPDIRQARGNDAHQLTSKAVLHQVEDAETSLFRVKPGGRIKSHRHNAVWDLFLGVSGDGVIAYIIDGVEHLTPLRAGAFCAMPPLVTHEVRNLSETDEVLFVLVHAPWKGYDHIPTRMDEVAPALA
jgi:mannose-6-phosphate isomerase-like protein (cupin superfamily)